ncbi:phage Gp37/Gp68 family protein [Desulfovibrio mangrovi]|uniref:phage Gp37/Gp68 family protein n=1 Tax=Desulfovibrio mangrovi TaxID=2976983 RepID=UPI002246AA88|nr:phage Gp37/Gp68 family protein [Desulfovibrio mangrovi]UZP67684.1 phage Gp37/Gp68 family protein [Desulfovibrio mangrovi]
MSSNIEWTDETWNPFVGCSKVSPACDNCYAEVMARRLAGNPATPYYAGTIADGKWNGNICAAFDSVWAKPFEWKKPKRIFVGSMTDVFHPNVPTEWLDMLFAVMGLNQQHTFMVLTKRAERMHQYVAGIGKHRSVDGPSRAAKKFSSSAVWEYTMCRGGFALPNVWLGVTTENQEQADKRIPALLDTPAAKRFVSIEPMLGPVDLTTIRHGADEALPVFGTQWGLDWVICGGESGPSARPSHPDWFRGLRDQCKEAGVPYFFKQWGEWAEDGWVHAGTSFDSNHITFNWNHEVAHSREELTPSCNFTMKRVGKKAAGHMLDRQEWRQVPEVKHG